MSPLSLMNRNSIFSAFLIHTFLLPCINSTSQRILSAFITGICPVQNGLTHSGLYSAMQDSRGYLSFDSFG
jgi:hypothetical protein